MDATNNKASSWGSLHEAFYQLGRTIIDITLIEQSYSLSNRVLPYLVAQVRYLQPDDDRIHSLKLFSHYVFYDYLKKEQKKELILSFHPTDLWFKCVDANLPDVVHYFIFKAIFLIRGDKEVKVKIGDDMLPEWLPHLKIHSEQFGRRDFNLPLLARDATDYALRNHVCGGI